MTLLASLVALVSLRYFFLSPEVAAGEPFGKSFAVNIVPLFFHAGGGIIALSVGAWGFWGRLRSRYLSLHRWMGRIYLLSVLVGGLAGFYLATMAFGGLLTRIGFSLLAVLWLVTGGMAYWRIRARDIEAHRRWMIRSYALTLSAVTLRLWLPLFISLGYEFTQSYMTVAWLCWIPNLLIAELIINNGKARARHRKLIQAV